MKSIIILAILVGLSYQMATVHHTHPPHTTPESSVHQSYVFYYDSVTHNMVVHKDRNCYIVLLTGQQKMDVHTESGLTTLEVQVLQKIVTGARGETLKEFLEHSIVQACGASILHYYLIF